TLALGEVAKHASISVDEAEIQAKMDEMMAEVEDPSRIDMNRLREVVNEDLLQERILAWIEENSTVELVPEGTLTPAASEEEADEEVPASAAEVEVDAVAVEDSEE
ncbi:MAG TPA: trigger factor, partial [Leptolyngbyaceae cyanobacterium]